MPRPRGPCPTTTVPRRAVRDATASAGARSASANTARRGYAVVPPVPRKAQRARRRVLPKRARTPVPGAIRGAASVGPAPARNALRVAQAAATAAGAAVGVSRCPDDPAVLVPPAPSAARVLVAAIRTRDSVSAASPSPAVRTRALTV